MPEKATSDRASWASFILDTKIWACCRDSWTWFTYGRPYWVRTTYTGQPKDNIMDIELIGYNKHRVDRIQT